MRTLVTGAGGFLGRYVAEQLLARGDSVRGLVRRDAPELAALGMEVVRGDVRDREAVASGMHGDRRRVSRRRRRRNLGSVAALLPDEHARHRERHRRLPRRRGSADWSTPPAPASRSTARRSAASTSRAPTPQRWLCHYPHSKALAEQAVLAANGPGLATCALRPHLIWGPRDQHLVPRLLARARAGRLRRVGDGTNRIDMIYVENAAAAHLLAADALAIGPGRGRAYYISQGEPVNCWDWIDELLALAGLPPIRRSISFRAAWRLGAAAEAIYGTAANSPRAADDPLSGQPVGPVPLLQHRPGAAILGLSPAGFDGRRHAAAGRIVARRVPVPIP